VLEARCVLGGARRLAGEDDVGLLGMVEAEEGQPDRTVGAMWLVAVVHGVVFDRVVLLDLDRAVVAGRVSRRGLLGRASRASQAGDEQGDEQQGQNPGDAATHDAPSPGWASGSRKFRR